MCGIFGVLNVTGGPPVDKEEGIRCTDSLHHRGPDDSGCYATPEVFLGHRRLSIIDLETGHQPIFNEDGSRCIVFNGEVFNYMEIRRELADLGHHFTTRSDSEVVLHAWEAWGADCLDRFRGMFSFAIWDEKRKQLFIARDRLGIKPLFIARRGHRLCFASEMKALLPMAGFSPRIDTDALAAYFTLSYIPAPLTIFSDIRKLPAGHYLLVKDGTVGIRQYWDVHFRPDYGRSEQQTIDGFLQRFEESVRLRLISDVPVGGFLSGGVDSGAVVATMSRLGGEPVRTFCMGFGGDIGGYLDERDLARRIAERHGAVHKEFEVIPEVGGILGGIVGAFDEPFADHSTIPTWYLCQMARRDVKVALSGLGGDEAFGGYERYLGFKISAAYNRLPWAVREKVVRRLVDLLPERADGHYTVNHLKRFVRSASEEGGERYFGFLSRFNGGRYAGLFADAGRFGASLDSCRTLVLDRFNAANADDPLDKVFYCDIKTYLPEDVLACTDRISMRHSLEVRVPFVDHQLLEFCATIPHRMKVRLRQKKYLLRRAVRHLLPEEVFHRRKQGFVGPLARWLQSDLQAYVREMLSEKHLSRHGLFNPRVVQSILDDHAGRIENNDKLIWSLVVFQSWYATYIEGQTPGGGN
ncbi:MAG: asparagine synthase (glutamine-hydrolyzing) [Desulfuromonadales bacterium]